MHTNDKNNNTRYSPYNQSTFQVHKHHGRSKKHGNAGRKKTKGFNNHNSGLTTNSQEKNIDNNSKKEDSEKQTRFKELLEIIENSYQNIYFDRCKSYKKAKLSDLDFEFDFSLFDSHNPYYPSALQDINTKINKTNSFWKSII